MTVGCRAEAVAETCVGPGLALRLRTLPLGPPVSCELSNSVGWRVQGQKTGAVETAELDSKGGDLHSGWVSGKSVPLDRVAW